MEIDFEPGWLCVCLSQKPGQAPLRPVAAGGLSLCRTKAGEHPAFVRRTKTRTKAERLRANRVRPVPFGFRQAAPGFQRWNAGRRRSAHDGPAIMEPAGPTSTRPSDRVIATGARRVGDTAGAPRHGRRPQRPGSRRARLRFAGSYSTLWPCETGRRRAIDHKCHQAVPVRGDTATLAPVRTQCSPWTLVGGWCFLREPLSLFLNGAIDRAGAAVRGPPCPPVPEANWV